MVLVLDQLEEVLTADGPPAAVAALIARVVEAGGARLRLVLAVDAAAAPRLPQLRDAAGAGADRDGLDEPRAPLARAGDGDPRAHGAAVGDLLRDRAIRRSRRRPLPRRPLPPAGAAADRARDRRAAADVDPQVRAHGRRRDVAGRRAPAPVRAGGRAHRAPGAGRDRARTASASLEALSAQHRHRSRDPRRGARAACRARGLLRARAAATTASAGRWRTPASRATSPSARSRIARRRRPRAAACAGA